MFETIGAGINGVALGWFLRGRLGASQAPSGQSKNSALRRNIDEAEDGYLEVLRGEIGNILINRDPDLMISGYEKGWRYQDEVIKAGKDSAMGPCQGLNTAYCGAR